MFFFISIFQKSFFKNFILNHLFHVKILDVIQYDAEIQTINANIILNS